MPRARLAFCLGLAFLLSPAVRAGDHAAVFNVRSFGAVGDGKALDTEAINRAVTAAAAAGGGTVHFPAGTYLSFTIRLKSNVSLYLDQGCVLLAATPAEGFGHYDLPEANEFSEYQDFGHSHWENSLIAGIGLENISILGPGLINGKALLRFGPPAPFGARAAGAAPPPPITPAPAAGGQGYGRNLNMTGQGNKAVGLKLCRNVVLRDFSVLSGGHFAVLATGVDNLTIDNLKVDTNRDGFDIDCCRNVRITNCSVNSPNDDGICLKSCYALGFNRATENVTITNCQVSGYDLGTFLDGTFQRTMEHAPDRDGPTGRIKLGTESNGGFRNITISNCVFDHCRGLAIESVDGGVIEDVTVSNLTMRDIVNSPLFIRLGSRLRGPDHPPVGAIRRISISDVVVSDADARYASLITGVPGHDVEDVTLSNVRIAYKGGITMEQVALQPSSLVNTFFQRAGGSLQGPPPPSPPTNPREPFAVPEREGGYPEPSMFGLLPAYGLFIRHTRNLRVQNVALNFIKPDERAPIVLMDVAGAAFEHVTAQRGRDTKFFVLREVLDFSTHHCPTLPDLQRDHAPDEAF